jgi:hypothetical protein
MVVPVSKPINLPDLPYSIDSKSIRQVIYIANPPDGYRHQYSGFDFYFP